MTQIIAGRYELQREVGRGGASIVYAALDRETGTACAVKILRTTGRDRERMLERFRRETDVQQRLKHPNILAVLDTGEDPRPFVVTELCLAGSLYDRVRRGALFIDEAIELVSQVGSALTFAHEMGVVHRDIKPANILIGSRGQALLCDFGIARDFLAKERYTRAGAAMGTLAFMPPEQRVDASAVDGRADQYALATTLYTLLSEESPFDLFLARPESPRWWGVPEALALVLQRAVHVDPGKRYPTMRAFVEALGRSVTQGAAGVQKKVLEAQASAAPKLVDWYRASVVQRSGEVREALNDLGHGRSQAGAELRRIAHMLKGSGTSFGFPMVTEAARAVEDAPDAELGNRASELLYVLRSVATASEETKARVGLYLPGDDGKIARAVFPDAVHGKTHSDLASLVHVGALDVIVVQATEASRERIAGLRAAGNDVGIVLVGADAPETWRAVGVDRVLSSPPDPVALAAAVRSLRSRTADETLFDDEDSFVRMLAANHEQLRVEPQTVIAVHAPDLSLGSLMPKDRGSSLGARIGKHPTGLLVLVPSQRSQQFLRLLPSDHAEDRSVATVQLLGQEPVPEVVSRVLAAARATPLGEVVALDAHERERHIVVIEDDLDVANLVCGVGVAAGAKVDHFIHGGDGLSAILESPPNLVVLDVDVPGLDGFTVLGRLRADARLRSTPVLMLTSHGESHDVVMALELGASDHVAKPFDLNVLDARIRNLLRR